MKTFTPTELLQAMKDTRTTLVCRPKIKHYFGALFHFEYDFKVDKVRVVNFDEPEFPEDWLDEDGLLLAEYADQDGNFDYEKLSPEDQNLWDEMVSEMDELITEDAFLEWYKETEWGVTNWEAVHAESA